jgi:hypothetical protein
VSAQFSMPSSHFTHRCTPGMLPGRPLRPQGRKPCH